jgi:spermidine synthase
MPAPQERTCTVRNPAWSVLALAVVLPAVAVGMAAGTAFGAGRGTAKPGVLEADTHSPYSHIRVRRQGTVKTLVFVRDNGEEAAETRVNTSKPHELLEPYCRFMFASYLFRPQPRRVLLVGLGGGAMVHFLQHYDPELKVDAVEIDPAVVQIAEKHFGVRGTETVKLITADGCEYLQKTNQRYDVIYIDAFLKPTGETDSTGVPLRLKTEKFYRTLQERLTPDGLVVFNLNRHQGTETDIGFIRVAFRQTYVFRVNAANTVAVASQAETRETAAALRARAHELDQRFKANFSFADLLSRLARM